MGARRYLVTGGSGFLGAALVRRLLGDGASVRVLDNNSRGSMRRLQGIERDLEFVEGDIRDPARVAEAVRGVDSVCHLAFVNGTEFFYSKPDLVLEVGVKGMVNVLDACLAHSVGELILASSSEVYQQPPRVPTDETVPLIVPDPHNPRYSYAGGKIISELLALNYGRSRLGRVVIFRPHNVYGPDMGWEHVVPQLVLRMAAAVAGTPSGPIPFPIQGDGQQTRAFVYIDDFTDGLSRVIRQGDHLGIYNIGTGEEVTIAALAQVIADDFGRNITLQPSESPTGQTSRRCPDITKLARLGYAPCISLREGVHRTATWYRANAHLQTA